MTNTNTNALAQFTESMEMLISEATVEIKSAANPRLAQHAEKTAQTMREILWLLTGHGTADWAIEVAIEYAKKFHIADRADVLIAIARYR